MKRIKNYDGQLSTKDRCLLLNVNRSKIYYEVKKESKEDMVIMVKMKEIYEKQPFYGYRKINAELKKIGYRHNHKKTQRLMQKMGMRAIYPEKKTTIRDKKQYVYPYLLSDIEVKKANYVWAIDITYIKLRKGFCYLACLIDVFSRKIMACEVSPFLDTKLCLDVLDKALKKGKPEIINSDQGCQFTSNKWINKLKENNIKISMDGKGCWYDNIIIERFWRSLKYELIYLNGFETVREVSNAISNYINFYNKERLHQTLDYKTPDTVYYSSINGNKDLLEQKYIDLKGGREVYQKRGFLLS